MDADGTLIGTDDRLSSLATELLEKIVAGLDPVGVIAISNTNRILRDKVDAGEEDFRNLVLALELTQRYGSAAPVRLDWSTPGALHQQQFSDPDIQSHRWACTRCPRLRSHVWFDNKSLTDLSYRKPDIGTPAAEPKPWVPASTRTEAALDALGTDTDPETQRKRRIYRAFFTFDLRNLYGRFEAQLQFGLAQARSLGLPEVTTLAQQPLNLDTPQRLHGQIVEEFNKLDGELRGNKRRFRTCIECQVQLVHNSSRACGRSIAPYAPIVRSRSMQFQSPLDRFFPEVATWPSRGPTPWPEYTGPYCEQLRPVLAARDWPDLLWPLHLIRCPGCHTWQEQRAFRLIEPDMLYEPPTEAYDSEIISRTGREIGVRLLLKEEVLCNHCFGKEHGEELLEAELVETFADIVIQEIALVRNTVYSDWQRFLRFVADQSDELLSLIYAHADPEVPRAYKMCPYQPRMTEEELEAVTARRFYKFAVAASEIMQSPRWIPFVGIRYFFWAGTSRNFIERWIWLEDVLYRLEYGHDSLSEWALDRRGPLLA